MILFVLHSRNKPMDHITPTSSIVERLFSRCGIIMRPHRRLMDPSTLEMLIMLRYNKDLWGAREVNAAMKRVTRAEMVHDVAPAPAAASTPLAPASLTEAMTSS